MLCYQGGKLGAERAKRGSLTPGFARPLVLFRQAGFNGLLDVARQTYKETTDDVYNLITSYAEQYGLPLKPHFNPTAGFQIVCPRDLVPHDLPLVFTNLVLRKKQAFFTTLDLKKYNERINESLAEIYLMSDKIVAELLSRARERIGVLYKASDAVALLDLVASFSAYCVLTACVRPEFTDTLVGCLPGEARSKLMLSPQAVKNGRHPIKEKISLDPFVPNDCYASSANSFQIVTGPNTSGKTTYLRSIALLQIMAQIGCYVPAEYASFRIADALFSRTCNDDAEELQASTFMIEMREVAHILRNATDRSLIIIDELGRATSTNDGLGISFAVAEALLKSKAFVFFATHFVQLAELLDGYPDVVNLHLSVALENKRGGKAGYKFLYTVKDGSTTEEHYGELAKVIRVSLLIACSEIVTARILRSPPRRSYGTSGGRPFTGTRGSRRLEAANRRRERKVAGNEALQEKGGGSLISSSRTSTAHPCQWSSFVWFRPASSSFNVSSRRKSRRRFRKRSWSSISRRCRTRSARRSNGSTGSPTTTRMR